jgi:hypothetical protein
MSHIENASTTGYDWFKSSYSSGDNNCVECATVPGIVPVRDSKDPNGPALTFSPASWGSFLDLVKGSELPSV